MQSLRNICSTILAKPLRLQNPNVISSCGIKYFAPPPNYDDVQIPENYKLKFFDKVPQFGNLKPPKMQKRLKLMRGPELIHNTLLHKQYGIIAKCGGRLRWEHMELMRLEMLRKLDPKRMFAVWRIDPPWQPITKKGQGQRMGGGKGAIDHYVTPVKAERVILEVAGKCEFQEVERIFNGIIPRLPIAAMGVSQEMLDEEAARRKMIQEQNTNPFDLEFIIKNNMGGCHKWLAPVDLKWYGKYR